MRTVSFESKKKKKKKTLQALNIENEGDQFQHIRKCFQHEAFSLPAISVSGVGLSAEGPLVQLLPRGNPSFLAQVMASCHTAPSEPALGHTAVSLLPFSAGQPGSGFLMITLSPPPFLTPLPHVSLSSLPLCLLFSEVSLQSKVVTLNSCFSNYPHVTGYLLIGGFP